MSTDEFRDRAMDLIEKTSDYISSIGECDSEIYSEIQKFFEDLEE